MGKLGGQWQVPRGPGGLLPAREIARGIPWIWTAPLLVNIYNPLYLEKPEWFAERADGQVQTDSYSYGPMAYLDRTVPEVIEHLRGSSAACVPTVSRSSRSISRTASSTPCASAMVGAWPRRPYPPRLHRHFGKPWPRGLPLPAARPTNPL